MKYVSKTALAAVIAVLCMSALMTSGALAANGKGELVNSKGQTLVKNKFKGATSYTKFYTVNAEGTKAQQAECGGGELSDAMTSTKAGSGTLTLTGCRGYLDAKCKTAGSSPGEWVLPLTVAVAPDNETDDNLEDRIKETSINCESVGVTMKIRGTFLIPVVLGSLRTEFGELASNGTSVSEPLQISQSVNKEGFEKATVVLELAHLKFEEAAEFI